jgi:uncharacterized RDD family membrane protein YckC
MFGLGKKKEKTEAPAEVPVDTPVAPPVAAVELQPAGFWLRVVAFIVDYAVLLILLAAMMMGAMSVGGEELAGPAYLLWVLATFLYWPVLESTAWRGTVGKRLVGIVVGDIDGGGLSFVRSLLRNLAKIISSIPFGIGFLMAAFTSRKQALHDLITKAVVMRKGPGSFVRAIGVLVLGLVLLVAGGYLSFDYMMGSAMKDMEAMMGGGVAQPPARPLAKPLAKPPAKPPVAVKPAAPSAPATTPAPTAASAPAATPAPAAPAPQAPAPAQSPVAKPAPSPVQVAQAPAAAKPVAEPKPAPAPAVTVAPTPKPAPTAAAVAKPAPSPAPQPAAAPAPVTKPTAAPVAEPEPAREAATPKAPEAMEAKPEATPVAPRVPAEPLVPLARLTIPAQPGPRFNDIMTAVLYRDQETVSQLLSLGRWPDKRDSNGLTPLMVAAGSGDAAMVRLLLERGANPDLQAPGGATALEFAQERGDAATSQLLQRRPPR